MSYFPMFVELQKKKCLVVGGGNVALRKIQTLLDFDAEVIAIAPVFLEEILHLEKSLSSDSKEKGHQSFHIIQKEVEEADIRQMDLVVAATDEKKRNHQIAEYCKKEKIPCNAVDQIEDCSFIFPSYVKQKEVVAAFSSGGQSPILTQYLKEVIQPTVTPQLGALSAYLGSLRQVVKETVADEWARKSCYREILQKGLEKNELPTQEETAEILKKYQNLKL